MRKLIFAILLLLLCPISYGFDLAYIVDSDTMYSHIWSLEQQVRDFYTQRLGYTVHCITDDSAAVTDWTSGDYDGIHWSNMTNRNLSAIGDSAIPIMTCKYYADQYLRLAAGNTGVSPPVQGGGQMYVNDDLTSHFIIDHLADTLHFEWEGGFQVAGLVQLASGCVSIRNTTRWKGSDTSAVVIIDAGGALTSGSAPARRGFYGAFQDCYEYPGINRCHPWELFGYEALWVFGDTLNETFLGCDCFVGRTEINGGWTETANPDSGCLNLEMRWGTDDADILLTFYKLLQPALERKLEGRQVDSARISWYVNNLAVNGAPADTNFDMTVYMYKITAPTKWHGPPYKWNSVAYGESTYVNRHVIVGGASPVPWNAKNLTAGVDYDATPGDSVHFRYDAPTRIGDSLVWHLPADWVNSWLTDSSTNNGVFFKPTSWCSTPPCDVEADPGNGSYGDQQGPNNYILWLWSSPVDNEPPTVGAGSIRMGAYMTGADNIPDDDVFERTPGDKDTFLDRFKVLIGIGSGMGAWFGEIWKHGCYASYYTSPYDMPPGHGCEIYGTGNLLYDIKHSFFTRDSLGEQWWLHFYDATCRHTTECVDGVGSYTIADADSVNRVWYYGTDYWSGNTFTCSTRPVYNFLSEEGKLREAEWTKALLEDSVDVWFPERTATGDTMLQGIYNDNCAKNQFSSVGASSGGAVCEMNGLVTGTQEAADTAWNHQKLMIRAQHDVVIDGDSMRVGINVGSQDWSDDYANDLPTGTFVLFEYGFDLLQVKGKPPSVGYDQYVWTIDSLAKFDSTACAHGISFFYCAGPWDEQGTYCKSIRDYHGFSNSAWSVYNRGVLYYMVRSDSTILYCMPDYYHGAYKGYAFDGMSAIYYNWDLQRPDTVYDQSFDTLSWRDYMAYDVGSPLGMPEIDTAYVYTWGGDGHVARIYARQYDSAYVYARPLDDGTVSWGKRAANDGLTCTVELPDTMRLLLPDGTLSDSSFTAYQFNPGDGFIFVPGYVEPPPPSPKHAQSINSKQTGLLNRKR